MKLVTPGDLGISWDGSVGLITCFTDLKTHDDREEPVPEGGPEQRHFFRLCERVFQPFRATWFSSAAKTGLFQAIWDFVTDPNHRMFLAKHMRNDVKSFKKCRSFMLVASCFRHTKAPIFAYDCPATN